MVRGVCSECINGLEKMENTELLSLFQSHYLQILVSMFQEKTNIRVILIDLKSRNITFVDG